jgi:hypothetical protein
MRSSFHHNTQKLVEAKCGTGSASKCCIDLPEPVRNSRYRNVKKPLPSSIGLLDQATTAHLRQGQRRERKQLVETCRRSLHQSPKTHSFGGPVSMGNVHSLAPTNVAYCLAQKGLEHRMQWNESRIPRAVSTHPDGQDSLDASG